MMTRSGVMELDNALDLFIGRTIYCLKNGIYDCQNLASIDEALKEKEFKFDKLPLENLYDYVHIEGNSSHIYKNDKLFSMLVDFKISLVGVFKAYYDFMLINNKLVRLGTCAADKIAAHEACVSFILKYRALFDKIMGLVVFVYLDDEQYEAFIGGKSMKKSFKKHMAENASWRKIEPFFDKLIEFDSYRTPEAHGSGRARKETIFYDGRYMDSEYHKKLLSDFFNPLVDFVNIFGQILNYAKFNDEKFLDIIIT